MQLYRTKYEAIIEAPLEEMRTIAAELSALRPGQRKVYLARPQPRTIEGAESGAKLVVTVDDKPFFSSWKAGVGLIIHAAPDSIQAFAEALDFKCEALPGLHAHWDPSALENVVDESIPIVIQLA